MALDAGDTGCTHGLSKRIHDNLLANAASGAQDGDALKALCYSIATAVVAEIQADAQVSGSSFNDSTGHPCSGTAGVG